MFKALQSMRKLSGAERRDEDGASAVEYGLLVALIAAVIVIAVFSLGGIVKNAFSSTCDGIKSGAGTAITATCSS
jgi:pilus assembly protein Flp/PilA